MFKPVLLTIVERYSEDKDRWITIGGDTGADGHKHGGHPVKISKDGEIKAGLGGKFNGRKIGEAFDSGHKDSVVSKQEKNAADSNAAATAFNKPEPVIISRSFTIGRDSYKQFFELDPATGEFTKAWPVDESPPSEIAKKALGAGQLKGDIRKLYMAEMKKIPTGGMPAFGHEKTEIKTKSAASFSSLPKDHPIHRAVIAEPIETVHEEALLSRLPTSQHADVREYAAVLTHGAKQTAIDDVHDYVDKEFLGTRKGLKTSIGGRSSTNIHYSENALKELGEGSLIAVRSGSQRNAQTSVYRKLQGEKWGKVATATGSLNDALDSLS